MPQNHKPTCDICGREEDGNPLGEFVVCELCGKTACPDCYQNNECCFEGFDYQMFVVLRDLTTRCLKRVDNLT